MLRGCLIAAEKARDDIDRDSQFGVDAGSPAVSEIELSEASVEPVEKKQLLVLELIIGGKIKRTGRYLDGVVVDVCDRQPLGAADDRTLWVNGTTVIDKQLAAVSEGAIRGRILFPDLAQQCCFKGENAERSAAKRAPRTTLQYSGEMAGDQTGDGTVDFFDELSVLEAKCLIRKWQDGMQARGHDRGA